jgi:D-sedoheptulose 7-phosphate isomerase
MKKNFFKNYNLEFCKLIDLDRNLIKNLEKIKSQLKIIKKKNKKVLIFGNGGSAAIANHFTIDLIKNTKIRCMNFNESSILTCLSNDYGYENWVKKVIEFYADKNDLIILISSSGESKNMINGCVAALKKRCFPIVTFTGFKKRNSLSKKGDINIWVNSKKYNHIENSHQFFLLSIIDSIKEDKF